MDKKAFLESTELRREPVTIAGLDGPLFVRELTLAERIELDRQATADGAPSRPSLLLVAAVVDESDNRVFSADEAAILDAKPAGILAPAAKKASELNLLGEEGEETARKNS